MNKNDLGIQILSDRRESPGGTVGYTESKFKKVKYFFYDENCFWFDYEGKRFGLPIIEINRLRKKAIDELEKAIEKTKRESIAWCECGDSLETKKIMRKDKKYGKIIDHYEYYCLGCDKTYTLTEKTQKKGGIKRMAHLEDCEDFARTSKTYREVLKHRKNCPKWGKDFCLECFGGGLTTFTMELGRERIPSMQKQ